MIDLRNDSYRKLAEEQRKKREEAAKKKAEEQSKSKVSIRSGNIVSSDTSSQVAISGGISENVYKEQVNPVTGNVYADVGQSPSWTPSGDKKSPGQVAAARDAFYGTSTVPVSGGVASRLAREGSNPMSIRDDRPGDVVVSKRSKPKITYGDNRRSVQPGTVGNYNPSMQVAPGGASRQNESYNAGVSRVDKVKQNAKNVVGSVGRQANYFLTGNGASGEYTNKFMGVSTPLVFRKEDVAAAELISFSYAGFSGKSPPVEPARFTFKARAVVKSVAGEDLLTSKGLIPVNAPAEVTVTRYGLLGKRVKSYEVSGVFKEVSRPTGEVGLVSGEPVMKSSGAGNYRLSVGGKKVGNVEVGTSGFEVGGFGQKDVVSNLVVAGRELPATRYSQSFVSSEVQGGEVVFGGAVSNKGVGVNVGKKMFEATGTKYTPIVRSTTLQDVDLGIRLADKEIGLAIGEQKVATQVELTGGVPYQSTEKIFDVRFAGQKAIPQSASLTQKGINSRLRSELEPGVVSFDVSRGVVNSVAREQATGGGGQLLVSNFRGGGFGSEVKTSVVQSVKLLESESSFRPVASGLVSLPSFASEKGLTVQQPMSSNVFVFEEQGTVNKQVPVNRQLSFGVRETGIVQSPVSGLSSGSRVFSGSKGFSKPFLEQGLFQNLGSGQVSVLKVNQLSNQASQSSQVSILKQSLLSKQLSNQFNVQPSVVNPGFVPVAGFVFPKFSEKGSFVVFGRRGGKFSKIGSTTEIGKAFKLGKSFVGNSAAASFKVVSGGKIVKPTGLSGSYYSKGGVVIEKPSFRIKSGGELREITYKGIASNRGKKSVGGLF